MVPIERKRSENFEFVKPWVCGRMKFVSLCAGILSFPKIMTRWDCDVRLWRGVPCSFPAFHGWPLSPFLNDDIVLSSTSSLRYVWCGGCYKWFPESSRYHRCVQGLHQQSSGENASDSACVSEDGTEEQPVYVIVTEENEAYSSCHVCTERFRMNFCQDVEAWVYMDCVEHEGVPVHKLCRDCLNPADSTEGSDDDIEEQALYVIVKEKHEAHFRCNLCSERFRMKYIQDIEDWVYLDCVEYEGIPVHKLCMDCLLS